MSRIGGVSGRTLPAAGRADTPTCDWASAQFQRVTGAHSEGRVA